MNDFSKKLFGIFKIYKSNELISNVDAKVICYSFKNKEIITTVLDEIKTNCYIVSPFNLIIAYSKDELVRLDSKVEKYFISVLIGIFEYILKLVKIDKVQILNNYMFSTNFFSKDFEELDVLELKNMAKEKYKDHSLMIRSINKIQNPKLFENLKKAGWINLVSRQVYIFDEILKCKNHQNYRRDRVLLDDARYVFKTINTNDFKLFEKAQELYDQLYLKKYSEHNIHFKAIYLQELTKQKLIHLRLLYDVREKKYVGVVGLVGEDGVITVPIVGYDLDYDIKEALYRRIIAYAIKYAMGKNYVLNLSSGAGEFKTIRGAKAHLEYMFVNVKHLSFHKRLIWKVLSLIANNFYGNILQRYKL